MASYKVYVPLILNLEVGGRNLTEAEAKQAALEDYARRIAEGVQLLCECEVRVDEEQVIVVPSP